MSRLLLIGLGLLLTDSLTLHAQVVQPKRSVPIRPRIPGPTGAAVEAMPLEECLEKIKSKEHQLHAIIALADHGPKASPAIPNLIEAIRMPDEDLRLNAALTLSKIGKAAVPELAKLLNDGRTEVRFYAIWSLGWIGPDAATTAPALVKAMADKNDDVRRKSAYALGRVAPDAQTAMPVLVAAFADANPDVRQSAADAAAHFGVKAVPWLIEALKRDANVRAAAAHAVGEIGSDAKSALPVLRQQLFDSKDRVPEDIAQALGKIGKESIPTLLHAINAGHRQLLDPCIAALGSIGADAAPNLVDLMGHKSAEVRMQATRALVPMRIGDKMVVLAFAYALQDPDNGVRHQAIAGLQTLGPLAKLAAPKAQEALVDPDPGLRQQAFYFLQQIGVDPRPGLRKALASGDEKVRVTTGALMVQMNVDRNEAIPVLRDFLKHKDVDLRIQAANSLAIAHSDVDQVMPILLEGLKNSNPGVRQASVQGIQYLGPQKAVGAVPTIVKLLDEDDKSFVTQAIYLLQNIQADPKIAVPPLARLVKDSNQQVRQAAAHALANLGGDGPDVLVKFFRETKDEGERMTILQQLMYSRSRDRALPIVAEAAEDKSAEVRRQAMQFVANLGQRGEESWKILSKGLEDGDASVRASAAHCLYVVMNNAALADKVNDLVGQRLKTEKDINVKRALIQGLSNYGASRKQALPLIIACLKDDDAQVRWTAAQMLPRFGAAALEAVPILEAMRNDPDETARQVAQNTLQQLSRFKKK
jgi:HEAT repeat protein